jgi:hypothetical protein
MSERWREPISDLPTREVAKAKANEGWRPIAIEWARDVAASSPETGRRPIPYGLRISSDCSHLEIDAIEREVMNIIVAMIAADHALSKVADELNHREYTTREGSRWTQIKLFKLLPRIVEFGPEILGAEQWSESKKSVLSAVS